MPNFAQFVAFKDDPFTLSATSTAPDQVLFGDETIPHLNDLDNARDAVLAFNVVSRGTGGRLTMTFNGQQVLGYIIFPGFRSRHVWHETLPGSILHVQNNQLAITVSNLLFIGMASITLSDFVLTYHASA